MTRTWSQTLIAQLLSLVILFGSAAGFGLGRYPRTAAAAIELEVQAAAHPPHVAVATLGATCGLGEEAVPAAVLARRPRFGTARCTD